jgi:biopolymer transport protein ExbB
MMEKMILEMKSGCTNTARRSNRGARLQSTVVLVALAAVTLVTVGAQAQDGMSVVGKKVDSRLESVLVELAKERERIANAKLPLSRVVSKLEDEVADLRRKQARLLKIEDSGTIDLGSLRKQVEALGGQNEFIKSRLGEFIRDFEGRLNISELPIYETLTSEAKLAEKNVNLDAEGKLDAELAVVEAALSRVDDQLGGQSFKGEALGPDGVLTQGIFLALGPTVFYVSDDGGVSGLVESQLNAADPVIVALPGSLSASFTQLASTGQGVLPLDPTLGRALKIEKAQKSIGQYIDEGGPVGYVILALGAAALFLTVFKAVEIFGFKVADLAVVDGILGELERGSQDAAAKRAAGVEGVSGQMLQTGVKHAREGRNVLEELLFEKILGVRPRVERFLPFLSITAAAAPLLGLLGTVIGMINTFQLITIFGTGDAKSLSSGISEALMTTALGLVVAIPTLILHGALSRMAKGKLVRLEEISVAFVNGIDVLKGAGRHDR